MTHAETPVLQWTAQTPEHACTGSNGPFWPLLSMRGIQIGIQWEFYRGVTARAIIDYMIADYFSESGHHA